MINAMTVKFQGNDLYAFRDDGNVVVALKPIVQAMGLAWGSQYNRLKRHPVLSEGIFVMKTPSKGGEQDTVCLALRLIYGWLFTIDATRVRSDLRERVLTFQRECYDVLWRHFSGEKTTIHQSSSYERRSIEMVREARILFGRRAGAQTWRERGLPIVSGMTETFRQLELFDKGAA